MRHIYHFVIIFVIYEYCHMLHGSTGYMGSQKADPTALF